MFVKSTLSISKKVLNEDTGELESKEFKEQYKKSSIRGGFNLMYHGKYEEVTEQALKSGTDIKIFNWITNSFKYQKVDVPLTYDRCKIKVSKAQFSKVLKRLVELKYIKRTSRGIYRLNPFIYVPYKANGAELQQEWEEL